MSDDSFVWDVFDAKVKPGFHVCDTSSRLRSMLVEGSPSPDACRVQECDFIFVLSLLFILSHGALIWVSCLLSADCLGGRWSVAS